MKVRWGCSEHTAVGFEHVTLDLDGQITQPALLTLPVQIVQNCSTGARKTHLDRQTGRSCRTTAVRIHGRRKPNGTKTPQTAQMITFSWWVSYNSGLKGWKVTVYHCFHFIQSFERKHFNTSQSSQEWTSKYIHPKGQTVQCIETAETHKLLLLIEVLQAAGSEPGTCFSYFG